MIHLVANSCKQLLFHFPSNRSFHYYRSLYLMSKSAHWLNLFRNKMETRKIVIRFCRKKFKNTTNWLLTGIGDQFNNSFVFLLWCDADQVHVTNHTEVQCLKPIGLMEKKEEDNYSKRQLKCEFNKSNKRFNETYPIGRVNIVFLIGIRESLEIAINLHWKCEE